MRYTTMQVFQDELKREEENVKDKVINAKEFNYTEHQYTNWADIQIAQKLGIPLKYYEKMKRETPELLVENVNTWLKRDDRKFLVRELDGKVRAVLSDRYLPLSNRLVCNTIGVTMYDMKVPFEVLRQWITDKSMFLTVVSPDKYDLGGGDTVQLGITVRNSEVGYSRFEVQTFMFRHACKNGAVFGRDDIGSYSKVHIGGRIKTTGYIDLSDTTKRLDIATTLSAMRDIVRSTFDPASFETYMAKIKAGKNVKVEDKVGAVDILSEQARLSDELEKLIMNQFNEPTQYGFANAVTAVARETADEEKQIELEELGGKLMLMDGKQFKNVYGKPRVNKYAGRVEQEVDVSFVKEN